MVPGGWQLHLQILNSTVTPESEQMTAELSTSGCGKTPWKIRESQELKFGCSALGLKVPANTRELARIEESPYGLVLLLGLSASKIDQQMAVSRQVQITSYDAPLHKVISKVMKPFTDASSKESPTSPQDSTVSTLNSTMSAFTSTKTQKRLPMATKALKSTEVSRPRVAVALLQSIPSKATSTFSSCVLLSILAILKLLM